MNMNIEQTKNWLNKHKTIKEWLWFIGLWFLGLFSALAMSYPIKLLIRSLGVLLLVNYTFLSV